jgi:predicted PhzF superfamily epimerase YddE/YHI9
VTFQTEKAGPLTVTRQGDLLALELPSRPPERCPEPAGLAAALGNKPVEVHAARDYLAVYDSADDVTALKPDFAAIAKLDRFAVIVTAPGSNDIDFVSRFFAPGHGVNEDPVTGSSHCSLVPYWAARLGKNRLAARQVSQRGGALTCTLEGSRVHLAGHAVLYLTGTIEV